MQRHHLLSGQEDCACGAAMSLQRYSRGQDGYIWRCPRHHCKATRYNSNRYFTCLEKDSRVVHLPCRSPKTGSFFAQTNLSLSKQLLTILHWAYDDQSKDVCERVSLSPKTGVQCFLYLRDICSWRLLQTPIRLGGTVGLHPNVCEIDESCFSHRPKVIFVQASFPKSVPN